MKKTISILVIGGLLGLNLLFCNKALGEWCPDTGEGSCDIGALSWSQTISGYQGVSCSVVAFASNRTGALSIASGLGMYTYGEGSMSNFDESGWQSTGINWVGIYCHGCWGDLYEMKCVVYPSGTCGVHECDEFPEPEITDTDDDGIPDEYDPYPDDPTPFSYNISYEVFDENGDVVAYQIATDRGDWFWYGDTQYANDCIAGLEPDCETKGYITIGGDKYPYDGTQIGNMGGDYDVELGSDPVTKTVVIDGSGERVVSDATGITEGVTSTGTETDNEALQKIVDNTGVQITNQQTLANYLKGIDSGILNLESRASEISSKLSSGTSSGTGDLTASGIADEIAADNSAEGDAVASEGTSVLNGISTDLGVGDGATYGEGDAPEENLFSTIMDGFLSSNPITGILGASGVETSNQLCSMEFEYLGHEVSLTMCQWEDELNVWGGILLALTGIISVMVVVKR